ncbi:MAG: diheme cytochrome c precursor [Planctomycetota bacterium]
MDPSSSLKEENLVPFRLRRFIPIIGAVIVGLALFGYLVGLKEMAPVERVATEPAVPEGNIPAAVTYAEMPTARLKPNPLDQQTLKDLKFDQPGLFDPVVRTEAMKLASLADRARNRAYDGAPPTAPHPVDQLSVAACLACHKDGIKVGDRVASRMSHALLSNCTQCHVSQISELPAAEQEESLAAFLGIERAGPGERASPGAPPTIPHHTWMRENCSSCHGVLTRSGTRTTHPWLTNCTQCHAPSADRDRSIFAGSQP